MYNCYIYYFIYILLLFTTTYASYYESSGCTYCKNDICVPCNNRVYLGTVIIPNNKGLNVTYITETCSPKDIDLNLCSSKECKDDTECLSNKCYKGHCSNENNEDNQAVQCTTVRTIHSNPFFGDGTGYKHHCGLPVGNKCKNNKDCVTYNCEYYPGSGGICEYPRDSGCHSSCAMDKAIIISILIPIYFILSIVFCCVCCCYKNHENSRKKIKYFSIILFIISVLPWIILILSDIDGLYKEEASIAGHIFAFIIIIIITIAIIWSICHFCKIKENNEDDENLV